MNVAALHDYVLRSGARGAERLRLLASVTWPSTKRFLRRLALCQGWHCLDVGCGNGAVTLRMAEIVGPSGRVVGVDCDEGCLLLTRREARTLGLNVEFRFGTADDLRETAAYDLVFARFLLSHLREPEKAVAEMVRAARPGGIVAVEDIQFTGHFSYPACPAFDRYVELYQQVVRRNGGDPNIGPRLPEMLLDAKLADVGLEVVQPAYRQGPGKQLAAVTMEHIREAVVRARLADDDEISAIVAELDSFASDSRSIMSLPRIFQVWGKPGFT
jgi:SAM-dependent methyltransferase